MTGRWLPTLAAFFSFAAHADGEHELRRRAHRARHGDRGGRRRLGGSPSFEFGGEEFDALHVGPAHTPEDLAVTVPAEGVLFAGDLAHNTYLLMEQEKP
jgi:glyoxylase-like metal-dependent hydrolase (beta-lactamase superfamily II)